MRSRLLATILLFLVATFLLFIAVASSNGVGRQNNRDYRAEVYEDETFEEGLRRNINFVMFYAPWCSHSKKLSPIWDELAKFYRNMEDSPVIIAKVDCSVHTDLCDSYEVVGFPTLKLFELDGENYKRYIGKHDLDSLKSFVRDQVYGSEVEEVSAPEDEDHPSEAGPVVLTEYTFVEHIERGPTFVQFFVPWCGHCKRLAPVWDELAVTFSLDDRVSIVKIDCTQSRAVCEQYKVKGYPTLVWFTDGEKHEKYVGARSYESLKIFVTSKLMEAAKERHGTDQERVIWREKFSQNLVKALTEKNFNSEISSGLVLVKFYTQRCRFCRKLAPIFEDVAEEFTDHYIRFAEVDCEMNKGLCRAHKIVDYPSMMVFYNGNYVRDYLGGYTMDGIQGFVTKMLKFHDEL